MRRSSAPSQRNVPLDVQRRTSTGSSSSRPVRASTLGGNKKDADGGDVVIGRMPLFEFLEIPDSINKQFRLPQGCIVTKENIELRKIKTIGGNRGFVPYRGGGTPFVPNSGFTPPLEEGEDEGDMEGLPTVPLVPFEPLILWIDKDKEDTGVEGDAPHKIEVIPSLASKLRPHQREGVQFLFDCTMGMKGFEGEGCILADDMGLGKTLMSITIMWTLLHQGKIKGQSAVKKVIVACPTSLVGNWDNEIRRWVGDSCPTFAVKGTDPKKIIRNYIQQRGKGVLIVSYETQRRYAKMFEPSKTNPTSTCDLLICDEAHKLKNAEAALTKALNGLPARKRILLSGTPMQNELTEFFNMVSFCNPGVLGTPQEFRKLYERPILLSREPHASSKEVQEATRLQKELSTIVNEFILKRGNTLNAQHLPPKLVQFVCCRLTPLQIKLYDTILTDKDLRHIREGKQTNTLNSIRQLISVCSHPLLVLESYRTRFARAEAAHEDPELKALADLVESRSKPIGSGSSSAFSLGAIRGGLRVASTATIPAPSSHTGGGSSAYETAVQCNRSSSVTDTYYVDPEQSGKLLVLYRMMQTLRALKTGERIVVVSNYTQTLDLIDRMCTTNHWPVLRLDGTTSATKRTSLVDTFNDLFSNSFVFLLSSKAGGCGINLIGGSRLVLFDPDWNPASDKQAAARIWREGQKRRCYIYRFMSTGSIEEKIIQRQLSKEGLQSIIDNKDEVNTFSTQDLKKLFARQPDTRSNTHETLKCQRCNNVRVLDTSDAIVEGAGDEGGGAASSSSMGKRGKGGVALNDMQVKECATFLSDFSSSLSALAAAVNQAAPMAELLENFTILHQELHSGKFASLPLFSRHLRLIVGGIESEIEGKEYLPKGVSISTEFVTRWTALVPVLSAMKEIDAVKKRGGGGEDEEEEEDEHVEQEGCPDENDFNNWSHHCNVSTCDDDILRQAMQDDNTVSFVFGLEVTWDRIQENQESKREEVETYKAQVKADLAELNAKRARTKRKEKGEESDGDHDEGEIKHEKKKKGKKKGDVDQEKKKRDVFADNDDEDEFAGAFIDDGDDSNGKTGKKDKGTLDLTLQDDEDEDSVKSGESDSGDSESGESDSNKTASYHESEEGIEGGVEKVGGLSRRERQKRAVITAKTKEKKGPVDDERKGIRTDKRSEREADQEKNGRIKKKVSDDTVATTGRGRVLVEDSDDDVFDTKPEPARGRLKKMVIEDEEEDENATTSKKKEADNGSDDDAFDTKPVPARGRPKKTVIEDEEEDENVTTSKKKADNGSDDDAFDTKPAARGRPKKMVINEDTEDDSPRGKEVKSSSKKKIDNDSDDDAFDTKPVPARGRPKKMVIADDTDEEKEAEKKKGLMGLQKKGGNNKHPSSSSSASKSASRKAVESTDDDDEKNKENKNDKSSVIKSNNVSSTNYVQAAEMRLKKNRKMPIGAAANSLNIQKGGLEDGEDNRKRDDGSLQHMIIEEEVDVEAGIVNGGNETDDRYWMCTHCSFNNDSVTDSRKCCMCEMRRVGDRNLKPVSLNDGSQSREKGNQKSESVKMGGDSSSSTSKRKTGEGDSLACLQTQSKNEKSQSQPLKRPSLAIHR